MIENIINELNINVDKLKESIKLDIVDVKEANHEKLLERNSLKVDYMENISNLKTKMNEELSREYTQGTDISKYKESIDLLEANLRELYDLNGRLASIVLPVKEMYKEIIDEITTANGGSLVEVMA